MSKIQIAELQENNSQFNELKDYESGAIIGGRGGGRRKAFRNKIPNINVSVQNIVIVPIQINNAVLTQIGYVNKGFITGNNKVSVGVGG